MRLITATLLTFDPLSERGGRTFPIAVIRLALLAWLAMGGTACATTVDCANGPTQAAAVNALSLTTLVWTPFRHPEIGWQIYAPRVATEIATTCAPVTPGFAAALARWQHAHKLAPTGVFDATSFVTMASIWQATRPFAAISARACPDPPPPEALATAAPRESYGGKIIQLRARALAAYRRMVAAARAEERVVKRDVEAFRIFSGFRDPDADALRCATEGNCNGTVRAVCSAHRTGLAIDLWVGQAPGLRPDSSADANRLAMVQGPEYRWLLANARRFGFVNYAFEPWHWEWTGEPVALWGATPPPPRASVPVERVAHATADH